MADDEPPADLSKVDLWERLRKLEQRVYPDRRDVMKMAGGAVAGGALGAAATGSASAGTAEAGQIGSAQYPQDAWVEDLYDKNDNHVAELPGDGSLNIDEAVINNAPTLYVRSGGSDANTGLDSSNPKATIQSAIDEAALAGYSDWITVDIKEDATFNEFISFEDYHPPVKISGNGEGNTTIDGGSSRPLDIYSSRVLLDSLTIQGEKGTRVNESAVCELSSATAKLSGNPSFPSAILVSDNSFLYVGSSSSVSDGGTGNKPLEFHASCGRIFGTVEGQASEIIPLEEGSVLFTFESTITGAGQGTTDRLFSVSEQSYLKLDGGDTYEDATAVAYLSSIGGMEWNGGTMNNVNQKYKFRTAGMGYAIDAETGKDIVKLPGSTSLPATTDIGSFEGVLHYLRASQSALHYYNHTESAWIPVGTREESNPSSSDVNDLETVFDTSNNRLVYKDSSGTLHYWDTDGTI